MGHRPRKRFGQNFLQDRYIIDSILRSFNPQPDEHVVEIGPGLGALTTPLLKWLNSLTAVEIDNDLHELLQDLPNAADRLRLITADALMVDYGELGENLRIIGNLPYNISTPLILHLLTFRSHIQDMHFMLQKEVVDRLAAQPGTKAFGRLTVMVQYACEVEHLFNVPPEAFFPKPKVDSAIVRLTPYTSSPYSEVVTRDLEYLVAMSFGMRRKTLANNLKPIFTAAELIALDIDPGLRPEQINIHQYVKLAKNLPNSVKLKNL
jgi:16S rRNA (adenine1518-N6/adenine1519-N6)-dimethyltransferase